jgi:hypothetical protein
MPMPTMSMKTATNTNHLPELECAARDIAGSA